MICGRSSPGFGRSTAGLRVTNTSNRCMTGRCALRASGLLTLALLAGVGQSFGAPAAGPAAARTFPIVYLREAYPGPRILPSLLETHPDDLGLAGAQEA